MAASVAQLVEHRSRKAGVTGSSPVAGSIECLSSQQWELFFYVHPAGARTDEVARREADRPAAYP